MTKYAQTETKIAFLDTDFGEEMARKWFGDEIVDQLPKYVRGKRAGKPKGVYTWTKVTRGGWVRTGRETANGDSTGYVENRVGQIIRREICELVSDMYGRACGQRLHVLEGNKTVEEHKNEERERMIEYWKRGILEAREDAHKLVEKIRKLREIIENPPNEETATPEAKEIFSGLICEKLGTLKLERQFLWGCLRELKKIQ